MEENSYQKQGKERSQTAGTMKRIIGERVKILHLFPIIGTFIEQQS